MTRTVAILGTRGYPSYYGGFETLVRVLAPYLADQGWQVTVYGRSKSAALRSEEADPRIRVVNTLGFEKKQLSTLSYGMTSIASAAFGRPDVALVMNVANGFWLPMLRARGIPTAVNVDGIEWERAKWGRAARRIFYRGARATARWADVLVCDAEAIANRWRSEFGRSGEFIPYGGVDAAASREVEGFPSGSYVLYVARFVPENSFDVFMKAIPKLAASHRVVVVGSSGYGGLLDEQMRDLAGATPGVVWLGHVADDRKLFALWQHAGVYFHGHTVGGTNPALVQAMHCGASIVARDTVYNREVLGSAGRFVSGEREDVAAEIGRLMSDQAERERLGGEAIQRARSEYSWDGVCGRYAAVLEALVDSRRSR